MTPISTRPGGSRVGRLAQDGSEMSGAPAGQMAAEQITAGQMSQNIEPSQQTAHSAADGQSSVPPEQHQFLFGEKEPQSPFTPEEKAYAYEKTGNPYLVHYQDMEIKLVVNAKGKICLVHDQPFRGTPLWIKYHQPYKRLEIIFDNGFSYIILDSVSEQMNKHLVNAARVLMILIENMLPIEGFDVMLLQSEEIFVQ